MASENKTLTVLGATGKMAIPLIRHLYSRGHQIRAVVRDVKKARRVLPANTEVVYGDVAETGTLTQAFAGTRHLYINLATNTTRRDLDFYPEREGVRNIVEAAQAAGVRQILQMTGLEIMYRDFNLDGFVYNRGLIRGQGHEYLFASDIPYTLFYCSAFLDILPWHIVSGRFMAFGKKPHPVYFTNSHDYARMVEAAIGNDAALNRKYRVQGKTPVSFDEAAPRFIEIYRPGTALRRMPIFAAKLLAYVKPELAMVAHASRFLTQYRETFVGQETWDELVAPEMAIEQFAQHLKQQHGEPA